jgi:hypothetical protein
MKKMEDGKPVVEATGKGLGVRGPGNVYADVDLDENGNVVLNGKGMSVAPGWRDFPPSPIPKRLREKYPAARGSSKTFCFAMGTGPFTDGPVAEGLDLRKDTANHANVVPRQLVQLDQFQAALAASRDAWSIDED